MPQNDFTLIESHLLTVICIDRMLKCQYFIAKQIETSIVVSLILYCNIARGFICSFLAWRQSEVDDHSTCSAADDQIRIQLSKSERLKC